MKNSLIILCFLVCGISFAQEPNTVESSSKEVFTIVESAAEYPGGMQQMTKFIQNNLKYPEKARELGMGGKVFLKFIINDEGRLVRPEVIKSCGFAVLDSEAVRVVGTMPMWTPAKMSGRPVNCYFNLPLSFAIGGPQLFINSENTNEKYLSAKKSLEKFDSDAALKFYQQDVGDVDAWYNMGVIYYWRNKKDEAKKYFQNVKDNAAADSKIYSLSAKILNESF